MTIFITGLYMSKDYGISRDDNWHRSSGQRVLVHIVKFFELTGDRPIPVTLNKLIDYDKNYGPIFDTISAVIEEYFSLNIRDVFLMRHVLNFIFFFLGYFCFFLLLNILFNDRKLVIILSLFYLLHPRLLGHGFFNPKDSILQAYVAFSLVPIIRTFLYNKYKDIIFSGILLGVAISTKIVSIYLPIIFSICILLLLNIKKISLINIIKMFITFYFFLFISTYICWPTIWGTSLSNLSEIFYTMKNFPWVGRNYIMGEYISGQTIPWYYTSLWISITTPIFFLLCWIIGIGDIFQSLLREWNQKTYINVFMIMGFIVPLSAVIILGSTLYNGWRHLFFIYPFLAYFMAQGFKTIVLWINYRFHFDKNKIIIILSIVVFSGPVYSIAIMHPNQQVYFNVFAGKDPMINYEGDYWGLSYRQGLEWIVKNDTRDSILVVGHITPVSKNRHIINKEDRDRLHFKISDTSEISKSLSRKDDYGQYFITNFSLQQPDLYKQAKLNLPPFNDEVYSINIEGMKVLGVYKLQ